MNKKEQQDYQAMDDAYILSKHQEIVSDKERYNRAVKFAEKQAKDLEKQANNFRAVAARKKSFSNKKKK